MIRFRNTVAVTFVLSLVIGLLVGFASAADATKDTGDGHKVTICHRTNSASNPYRVITVDRAAVDGSKKNDHSHHDGPVFDPEVHDQQNRGWGDIIPPLDGIDSGEGVGNGKNWTANGQEIYNNGCEVPEPPCDTTDPESECYEEPECETDCEPVRQVDVNINCDKLVVDSTEDFSAVIVQYGDFDYEFDVDGPWFLWDFPGDDDHSIEVVTVVFGDGEEFEFVSQVDCDREPEPEPSPSVTPTPEPSPPVVVVDPPEAFPDLEFEDPRTPDNPPSIEREPVVEELPEAGIEGAAALFVLALCLLASGGWIVRKYGWMN